MERVLVTGAGGFIGRRLLAWLSAQGWQVRGMWRPGATATAGVEAVFADLGDPASLREAARDVGAVVHCAGHPDAGDRDPERQNAINYLGTVNLVEAALAQGVQRFVFLSSVKAMGPPGRECVDESWAAEPATPYGLAKRRAEAAVLDAARRGRLRATNLRLAAVYGPGGQGAVNRMIAAVRSGWFPPPPRLDNRRSLVHVDDVCAAVARVLRAERAGGNTYILAHPDPVSPAELYDAVRRRLHRSVPGVRVPAQALRLAGRLGSVCARVTRRRCPVTTQAVASLLEPECYSPARLERELGWRAGVALRQGIDSVLASLGGR